MAHLEDFDSSLEKALSALAGLGISLELRSEQKARFISSSSKRLWKKPHFSVVGAGNLRAPRFSSAFQLFIHLALK